MKRKKKFLMLFGLLSLVGINGYAQDKVPGIIVELSSGAKVEYRLADNPKMVFDGQTIKLTAEGVAVEYTPSELLKVTPGEVADISSGIDEVVPMQGDIKMEAGLVRLTGFTNSEAVRVYTVGGSLTATYQTSTAGSLIIPISSLPSGISIIKINEQTIKITRR
ncbi:MAG: hypothetical protein J6M01_03960 [Prevotella sp.]|nr:hypothetical protein [Prevotella sp.]